jgi:SAM-dependent methyltransferase
LRRTCNAARVEYASPVSPSPANNPGTISASTLDRLAQLTERLKDRITSLLELVPGNRVLDVGCGPAIDTLAMSYRVCPGGQVVGIDYDAAMIDEARRRTRQAGRTRSVRHDTADAAALPFPNQSFDACRCERVLQHALGAPPIVSEVVHVTKPGGRVVVADTDWATLSSDAPIERAFVRLIGDSLCNGYAGRQLWRLFNDQGLTGIGIEIWPIVWTSYSTFSGTSPSLPDLDRRAVQAGAVLALALACFRESLVEADRGGAFFATGYVPGRAAATTHACAVVSRQSVRGHPRAEVSVRARQAASPTISLPGAVGHISIRGQAADDERQQPGEGNARTSRRSCATIRLRRPPG